MKVALAIIARPVESLLVLCLRPIISHFDGLVILTSPDPEWKEGVASLVHNERRFSLFDDYEWRNDYADARNVLIGHTTRLGYDWIMMLDADESMLPDDVIVMRKYMDNGEESLFFPRYEFVDDFHHFCPAFYPDYQARAFRLNMGYHYDGAVHEQLRKGNIKSAVMLPCSTILPMIHIFHYGKSKPTEEVWEKYDAYKRIAEGKQPRTRPEDVPLPQSWALDKKKVAFLGNKPL